MTSTSHRDFSNRYIGLPYQQVDCVDLLVMVQKEIFGRMLDLPNDRNSARRQFQTLLRQYAEPVDNPQVGDLVFMRDYYQKYPSHVGTLFKMAGDSWVLHTTEKTDSVFHRVRQIAHLGIAIEGYYTWKTPS